MCSSDCGKDLQINTVVHTASALAVVPLMKKSRPLAFLGIATCALTTYNVWHSAVRRRKNILRPSNKTADETIRSQASTCGMMATYIVTLGYVMSPLSRSVRTLGTCVLAYSLYGLGEAWYIHKNKPLKK
jgi:hypothetical protein